MIVCATGPADIILSPYRGAAPPRHSPYRPLTSLTHWGNVPFCSRDVRPTPRQSWPHSHRPTDPARFVYLAQSKIMTSRSDEAREDVREGLTKFPRDERLLGQAEELGLEPPT